ncbi:MAG TPA: glycine--tRNA ligase subunit beta [Rhizomicrobium sp.]|jgi:glycyl-tRNA synthetase beta chain|nr:glycine--tRNA ligase subunit beta [Rhizomicrobium sp.]
MPDLLLELFSEEIPARMQAQAAKDLERLVVGALSDRGLLFEAAKSFAGPRRLTLAIAGLPAKQPDVSEELKGPKVGATQAALEGFLRKTGLSKEQLRIEKTPKGDVYIGVIERKGRATAEVLGEILPETFAKLPWPKSMRFPDSTVRWVRPLHGIVCTFDGEVVPFEFAGVKSGNVTHGHRFLSHGPIEVRRFEDYEEKLRKAHVILDPAERKEIILHDARNAAFAQRLAIVEDAGLLDEVVGLAEWPVVLIGSIEDEFMDLPPEILQTSMRTHQKYFALKELRGDKLANRFAVVANMVAEDGGKQIVAGNERVLRARLSDAKFFWDQDRKIGLQSFGTHLKDIIFHNELGFVEDRVNRIERVANAIADQLKADRTEQIDIAQAAQFCKADVTTGIVGEFPELQGIMGWYYAKELHLPDTVADAIRDHYRPLGPRDACPKNRVSIAVALADKIEALVGMFGVGERPTGSGDPFALRRAALGIVRIVLENNVRLRLVDLLDRARLSNRDTAYRMLLSANRKQKDTAFQDASLNSEIFAFIVDRLKVALREKGTRHDLIDAVFSLGNEDDLVRLVARVEALQAFLKTDDGANLLVAYRRAANILRDEEKRDKTSYDGEPDPELLTAAEEKALFVELATASELIRAEVERERFVEAMGVMARLRAPVDAFFDKVTVNDKNPELRQNRLKLLSRLRATLHLVADFSKIEG